MSRHWGHFIIPLNVVYGKKESPNKNHWIALIIDKKNELIFCLDPAKKTKFSKEINALTDFLSYKKPIIMNPIDFQQKEKEEGWVRHCGPYIIEIFKEFANTKQRVSGSVFPDISIPDSISVQTILSSINCGDAENIKKIRGLHIEEAHNVIVPYSSENSENIKSVKFDKAVNSEGSLRNAHNQALIKLLLTEFSHFIDPNIRGLEQKSALMVAVEKKQTGTIILLLKHPKINIHQVDLKGNKALHYAAKENHSESVKLLMKKGDSIKYKNKDKMTPLKIAIENNHHNLAGWMESRHQAKKLKPFLKPLQEKIAEQEEMIKKQQVKIEKLEKITIIFQAK